MATGSLHRCNLLIVRHAAREVRFQREACGLFYLAVIGASNIGWDGLDATKSGILRAVCVAEAAVTVGNEKRRSGRALWTKSA